MMEILAASSNQIDVKNLLNALRATIKFENKLYEDLRKEYQQYIGTTDVKAVKTDDLKLDEDDEKVLEEYFRISQIPRIKGTFNFFLKIRFYLILF